MNSFYILIQSQTIMDGKFIDFYNNYIKSHTNNDFLLIDSVQTVHRNLYFI